MAKFEDEDPFVAAPRPAPSRHEIGQPLDALSLHELEERIALLRGEIARLEQVRDTKSASLQAADAFFRK